MSVICRDCDGSVFAFVVILQNNPLYIQSFTEADDVLKLHHIVHCSLDVIDERGDSFFLFLFLFFFFFREGVRSS